MDKTNEMFLYPFAEHIWRNPEFDKTSSHSGVRIADERVARLLTVLHELDESVGGLEELPNDELVPGLTAVRILPLLCPEGRNAR